MYQSNNQGRTDMAYFADTMKNRIGYTTVVVNDKGAVAGLYVSSLDKPNAGRQFAESYFESCTWNRQNCAKAMKQIKEYYQKKRKKFDFKIELDTTQFRHQVWTELMNIPYGETVTYGDVAKRIGQPKASRAVGQANNKNPIMIVVP